MKFEQSRHRRVNINLLYFKLKQWHLQYKKQSRIYKILSQLKKNGSGPKVSFLN